MSVSKTAQASSGQKKSQAARLCSQCNQVIIPVLFVIGGKKGRMVWRHKIDMSELCQKTQSVS